MKNTSLSELDRIKAQFRRTLQVLEEHGEKALRRATDWATPLSSSQGPGAKNGVSDPTGNAGCTVDPLREQWTLLSVELGHGFDAAVAIESRVCRLASDAVAVNERAGIGWCACGRYCDGSKSNRLRSGQCPACAVKEYRKKPPPCEHTKTVWSHGTRVCANPSCAALLESA